MVCFLNFSTTKNGMLPITLPQVKIDILMADCDGGEMEVDLINQTITRPNGSTISFEIDEFRKHCLVNGLDDIGLTLQHEDVIRSFEEKREKEFPWLNGFKPGAISAGGAKKVDW
jgi:3-isopropylmalate dehydratase small subunit